MKKPGWKQVPHEVRSFALSEGSQLGCASVRIRLCSVWAFRLTHWLAFWRPFPVAYLHRRFLCRTATRRRRIAFGSGSSVLAVKVVQGSSVTVSGPLKPHVSPALNYDRDSKLVRRIRRGSRTSLFVIRSFWFVRRRD